MTKQNTRIHPTTGSHGISSEALLSWFQKHDEALGYLVFVVIAFIFFYIFAYPTFKPHTFNQTYLATIGSSEYNVTWTVNQGWLVTNSCILSVNYLKGNSTGLYKTLITNRSAALEIAAYAVTPENINYTKTYNCTVEQ